MFPTSSRRNSNRSVSAAQYQAVVAELSEANSDIHVLQQRVEYLQRKVALLESEVERAMTKRD